MNFILLSTQYKVQARLSYAAGRVRNAQLMVLGDVGPPESTNVVRLIRRH